jgi:hypothetical protein
VPAFARIATIEHLERGLHAAFHEETTLAQLSLEEDDVALAVAADAVLGTPERAALMEDVGIGRIKYSVVVRYSSPNAPAPWGSGSRNMRAQPRMRSAVSVSTTNLISEARDRTS